ncbi:coiled-coil domain-containing protein 33 isoform X2 [Protopterus annectens]|uniref:coiled-coil domain-containing protein 33 isoform X2 n=1 Tax=Protopterus annectens TaxID=7888 RepID=UPI001CF9AD5A|nr:coiled-coil domain-containing protein 33 isoform X2 [Protopterus annectens]
MLRLFITIIRRASFIPRQAGFSFTGFEVLLQAVEKPLRNPVGPLLAVARIVSNYKAYKETMLMRRPKAAGITMTTIMFPNPRLSSFEVHHGSSNGHPQVTVAGLPPQQPRWNHLFLFQGRDCATIFTDGSALILEYYAVTTVMNVVFWNVCSPLGFSALPLNQEVYKQLVSESGKDGVQLENLPIQGTILKTTSNTIPTVGLLLHLVVSERPDSFLPDTNLHGLPFLQLKPFSQLYHKATGVAKVPEGYPMPSTKDEGSLYAAVHKVEPSNTELQKDGASLPSHDALAKLLPEYEHLFRVQGPSEWKQTEQNEDPRPQQTEELRNVENGGETTRHIDFELEPREVTSHEVKELENYRAAMQKMAEDIISLRQHLSSLESENSKLRSELSLHEDVGRTLLEDTDIDVMTKAEIADRIASLRHKLASETAEMQQFKNKIQQLQNELIRKNDSEKELLLLQRAHQQQQAVLEKYQEKLRRAKLLEDTIRQQEKVIDKMEKVLESKLKQKPQEKPRGSKRNQASADAEHKWNEINSALTSENSRLRNELEKLRSQPPVPIILQQESHQVQDLFSDSEKLSLLTKLERAQGRIELLESQLEENARKWGREKQELLTRLMEQEHGFARTSTMVLHDFPLKKASDSLMTHSRHRKLEPLI